MKDSNRLNARDVMTSPLITLDFDTPLREAARILSDHSISGALVKDHRGEPVGVISLFDIVTYLAGLERPAGEPGGFYSYSYPKFREGGDGWEEEWEDIELSSLNEIAIEEIMSTEILSVPEETPLNEVVRRLAERRIHRLFVSRDGSPIGVISTMDIMRELSGLRRSTRVTTGR